MNRNESKHPCVFLMKRNGKPYRYMVRTYINKERRYIGCFEKEADAIKAYDRFMRQEGIKMQQLRS